MTGDRRFWSAVVFFTGLWMSVWNAYLLFRVRAGAADTLFRILMLAVIMLITWLAYGQWRKK